MVICRAMLILPISKGWMLSRTARRVYTICAVLTLTLAGTLIGTRAAQEVAHIKTLPPLTDAVFTVVWMPGIAGAALLWVGMFYFWFGFDHSHWLWRAFWFLALFQFAPLGPTLYCFLVYRRLTREATDTPGLSAPLPR